MRFGTETKLPKMVYSFQDYNYLQASFLFSILYNLTTAHFYKNKKYNLIESIIQEAIIVRTLSKPQKKTGLKLNMHHARNNTRLRLASTRGVGIPEAEDA